MLAADYTPTGFKYVANVPPMAIGPQFAGPVTFQRGLGQAATTALTAGFALLIGIPVVFYLLRPKRGTLGRGRRRRSR